MKNNLKIYYPEDKNVINFIKSFNTIFDKKLTNKFSYTRVVLLSDFKRLITEKNLNKFLKVAVISGSLEEPELKFITYKDLDILDFDEVSNVYNLDDDWETSKFYRDKKSQYDFVICNQVFEHIFSPSRGIKNIHFITKPNGYVWISLPTINCIHGEPHFYSAGYHPRYLNRLCEEADFEVLHVGAFGNRKYLAYAVQGCWLTHDELKIGFRSKLDLALPYFAIQDGRKNDTRGNFITDTWALLRKKEI
jgi:SAM-dependent methyltransferase